MLCKYIHILYPPPRFARRREWVVKHACPCPLALALVPVLARALALVPVLAHAQALALKNLGLGGRKISASGWPRQRARGLTPSKTSQNH